MAAGRLVLPQWMPAIDSDGIPLPNAEAFFYQNKTTILATIYADEDLTTALPNPVAANSSGRFPAIWADDGSLYSATVTADYAPQGTPFTFDDLRPSQAADAVIADQAEAAAAQAAIDAASAAQALAEIQDIAANAPDAPSVANKANRDLDNVTTADFSAKALIPTGGDTEVELADSVEIYAEANGAVANVFDAPSAALNVAALNKTVPPGRMLDGKGQVYAVDGRWTASVTPRLKNGTLRQIATTGTARDIMVVIDGKDDFLIEDFIFDQNNIAARSGVTFGNTFIVNIKNSSGFKISRSMVKNAGAHTGWLFENCSDFYFEESGAEDFDAVMASEPSDDVAAGVSLVNCTRFKIKGGSSRNISASWPGQPSPRRLYTRGISFSGCSFGEIRDMDVAFVDQGFDNTGQTNHDLYFWNISASDCSTYGFKASNRSYNIFVDGMRVDRPGWAGVATMSPYAAATPFVQNIRYSNVHVHNCGENSVYDVTDGRNPFQILHTGFTPGYPAGVYYDNCSWTDDQTVKTTDQGFAQRGTITPRTPTTTIPPNQISPTCTGQGLAVGGVSQSGMNFSNCTVTGSATPLALASGSIVPLVFTVPVYDPSVMFDAVNGRIYAPEDGDYDFGLMVSFANSAGGTGIGETFLFKNGSEIGANYRASSRVDTAANVRVEMVRPIRLLKGDYVSSQARQTTGSSMNIALNGALMWLRKRNNFS